MAYGSDLDSDPPQKRAGFAHLLYVSLFWKTLGTCFQTPQKRNKQGNKLPPEQLLLSRTSRNEGGERFFLRGVDTDDNDSIWVGAKSVGKLLG